MDATLDGLNPWLGNIYLLDVGRHWTALLCIVASALCGATIGLERERRDKPAGMRTVVLIALGTTIFTVISLLLAERKAMADPARLAAQILPGIGFLGAGAIIRDRGTVRGLTTGATIWAVAAVGVAIGSGYIAGGVVFTALIIGALVGLAGLERLIGGPCEMHRVLVSYEPHGGKTLIRLRELIDGHGRGRLVSADPMGSADEHVLEFTACVKHRDHRRILSELAARSDITAIDVAG